jgi:hypothetical protein
MTYSETTLYIVSGLIVLVWYYSCRTEYYKALSRNQESVIDNLLVRNQLLQDEVFKQHNKTHEKLSDVHSQLFATVTTLTKDRGA